jgi:hypothetical protein
MAETNKDGQSKLKKFLKGPWLWIAIALSVVFVGTSLINTEQSPR